MERWPDWLQSLDERLFLAINGFLHRRESEAVENLLRFANALGTWPSVLVLLVVSSVVSRGARVRRFCEVSIAGALGFAGSNALKGWIQHSRPRVALPDAFVDGRAAEAFGEVLKSRSFPSGHTTTAFALAVLLAVWSRSVDGPWRRTIAVVAAFTFASLTGVARIYAGAHFPLDVLGGAALGSAAAGLALLIVAGLAGPRASAPTPPAPLPPPA